MQKSVSEDTFFETVGETYQFSKIAREVATFEVFILSKLCKDFKVKTILSRVV